MKMRRRRPTYRDNRSLSVAMGLGGFLVVAVIAASVGQSYEDRIAYWVGVIAAAVGAAIFIWLFWRFGARGVDLSPDEITTRNLFETRRVPLESARRFELAQGGSYWKSEDAVLVTVSGERLAVESWLQSVVRPSPERSSSAVHSMNEALSRQQNDSR